MMSYVKVVNYQFEDINSQVIQCGYNPKRKSNIYRECHNLLYLFKIGTPSILKLLISHHKMTIQCCKCVPNKADSHVPACVQNNNR